MPLFWLLFFRKTILLSFHWMNWMVTMLNKDSSCQGKTPWSVFPYPGYRGSAVLLRFS